MLTEVEYAVKVAKNNKAPRPDEVYGEYLKLLDNRSLKYLIKLFNLISIIVVKSRLTGKSQFLSFCLKKQKDPH